LFICAYLTHLLEELSFHIAQFARDPSDLVLVLGCLCMEEVELLSHLTHLALALRQAGLVDTELVRDLGAGLASKNRL